MTEIQLKDIILKATRAEQLLNDPLIQEFIIQMRGDLLNKFESAGLDSNEERLAAWHQSQVLNMFLDKFKKKIKEGKTAQLSLLDKANAQIRRII
tara:strand:- start:118 stop:402 length:285 start_codon:yes stop_codon:yes gene_type:complete